MSARDAEGVDYIRSIQNAHRIPNLRAPGSLREPGCDAFKIVFDGNIAFYPNGVLFCPPVRERNAAAFDISRECGAESGFVIGTEMIVERPVRFWF
jgi:hypothetical protein